jgi:hypothetical protein
VTTNLFLHLIKTYVNLYNYINYDFYLIDSNSKEIYENQIPVRMKGIEREEY